MNYKEALDFIHSTSWQGSRLGLDRTRELLTRLGDPQKKLRFVHIAGTNGKGSTAAMLASILTEAGYKTGLNTSPYLYRFNERMQVDGIPIADELLASLTERLAAAAEEMEDHPTEFELVTALSFLYFAEMQCEIVVLEVGLGGRLDSTNVIETNEVAIITTIGLDHTEILGNTLEAIATEKVGIAKQGCPVVVSGQPQSVLDAVARVCRPLHAAVTVADPQAVRLRQATIEGQQFDWKTMESLSVPLVGAHQRSNAATVLEAVEVLRSRGWQLPESAVRAGLAKTCWPGRFERLKKQPCFIVDGGHNPQCAETVARTLEELFLGKKIIFLVGLLADKDFDGVMRKVAPLAKRFFTVQPDSPRALTAAQLAEKLRTAYPDAAVTPCASVREGVAAAVAAAEPDDVVCAFGSLYMVGEIRHCLIRENGERKEQNHEK